MFIALLLLTIIVLAIVVPMYNGRKKFRAITNTQVGLHEDREYFYIKSAGCKYMFTHEQMIVARQRAERNSHLL